MPRGPRGEKRPADVIGNAVKVMRMRPARSRKRPIHRDRPPRCSKRLRGLVYRPRMGADKVWNGGRVLDRLKIVEIRLSDCAASQRSPRASQFSGTTEN